MKLTNIVVVSTALCTIAIGCMAESPDEGPMAAASDSLIGTGTTQVANASAHPATGFWFNASKTAGRNGTVICKRPSAYTSYRVGALTATHGGPAPQGAFTVRATSASYTFSANAVVFGTTTFVKMTSASAPNGQTVIPVSVTGGTGTAGDLWDSGSETYYPTQVSKAAMTIAATATDCDTGASGTQKWLQTVSGTVSRETDDGGDAFISGGALQGLKEGEDSGGDGNALTCMTPFTSTDVSNIDAQCRSWCNAPCGVSDAKVVFVTATSYTGNLGGLAGANTICQNAANANGLTGTFKAWLSDSTTSAATNISTHATIPYVRRDGVLLANNWADLTDGALAAPINVTESGGVSAATFAWTNTRTDGTTNSTTNCSSWTSTSSSLFGYGGYPQSSGGGWTDPTDKFKCLESYPIYCVQN